MKDTFFKMFATEEEFKKYIGEGETFTQLRVFLIILFWPQLFSM
jgi:hypothetical protein